MGGTMRLGAYECILKQGSRVFDTYKESIIQERHVTVMSSITNFNKNMKEPE